MSLRFITGRAGSGKTHLCLEEIAETLRESPLGPPLVFLVPEQASFQTEHALCSRPGLSGFLRAEVLSFRRLAHRILAEVGGAAEPHIGDLAKQMLLRRFLEAHRAELKAFNRIPAAPGFLERIAGAISEFRVYGISSETLASAAVSFRSAGETSLSDKIDDLQLLYSDLHNAMIGRHTDPDDYLDSLARSIPLSGIIQDSTVWVDGFSGFTPQEYTVLEALIRHAQRVNIALCLNGPEALSGVATSDVFHITRETYRRIAEFAQQEGMALEPPVHLTVNPRFQLSPAIAHLEQNLAGEAAGVFVGEPAGLLLSVAADRRAEVEASAREIIHLCRDQGYCFRQISVVLRQPDLYQELIQTVFADHGIPFFVDLKRGVMHHPVVELIRSALDTVLSRWAYDPVFRYLKTDLAPVDRESVDLLENYVLAYGIQGSRWTDGSDWAYRRRRHLDEAENGPSEGEQAFLERINRIRRIGTDALAAFEREVRKASDVTQLTAGLVNLLLRLDVPGQLEAWSGQAQDAGKPEAAREYAQLWNGITDLFDQLVDCLGAESIPLEEYTRILDAGLESLHLALIPPAVDQVLIGTLDRSRNPDIRAAFVLGVNDGVLPSRHSEHGLFTDTERGKLAESGVVLSPGIWERHLEEQFLVYIAFTRASEYLWVSYALSEEEGRALAPSVLIDRIQRLFPALREVVYTVEPAPGQNELHYIARPNTVIPFLAVQLREQLRGNPISAIWWDVYNWLTAHPKLSARTASVVRSLSYMNREAELTAEQAEQLYGSPLRTSVSRIEKLNSCPFAHFSSYGLRLRERQEYRLGAPDLGEFLHAALRRFAERAEETVGDWALLTETDCADLAAEVVSELTPSLQHEILLSTARYRHLGAKVQQTVTRAASVLAEHARQSGFRPVALELGFGPGAALTPPPIRLENGRTIELGGRIDRLDVARDGDHHYLRVIDYKSGVARPDLSMVYHGLQIQLLAYLDVALSCASQLLGHEAKPGGMLYFRAYNPLLSADGPLDDADIEARIVKKMKMTGLLVANPDVLSLMDRDLVPGRMSRLVPAGITTKGAFHRSSSVVTEEQLENLRLHLHHLIRTAGEQTFRGVIDIAPAVLGVYSACRFCPFKPVCHYDPLLGGNAYRLLTVPSPSELWIHQRHQGFGKGEGRDGG
ncbi:MAG: helicase-exonuclease AddAB subunit AddB [Eubacteriales bacterium]|nr:helicase-exonuclease AddAB subunit AddB [Bacillota bacterium]MBV1728297.1 helicase-exonuclease AddAB subunit AddB [Desulforudis sp.]MDQ7789203.1 helicase-exonuclease AddAB subunit AddB [Clostridia bacterium]MDZ4042439.1 helicase-exonuclease AddAB subunit AddB [Eubacteriales bacterium]MBU4533845.1 helicase-exonuclease AddAB subunit AddB [Bacillota bacterium]